MNCLTQQHTSRTLPVAPMLLAPELNDVPGGSLSGVVRARHPYLPELQSAARAATIGHEVVSGLEGLGWFWLRRVTADNL